MQSMILHRLKDFLWAIVFAGIVAATLRLILGLGATTGLNDASPWGLWIAFKLCFVALAGGGFTLAAMVYIFHLETYRPLLRRAILLALLGYGSFIVSLLFDLGLPWHIYMPLIHWQHHSVMFEIAWCVMLYFSVLVMEFGPVILEHPWFRHPWYQAVLHFLKKATVPLVIAGIVLSTLHQSSLGALFLIMPHRVHPLWYSPLIPVLFFISAVGAGMMALIVENFIARALFGRGFQPGLLERVARVGGFALWLYLLLRLGDLFVRGVFPSALDGSWESLLFTAEILVAGILPAILLMVPAVRRRPEVLLSVALLAIAGVVSQRMSLSLFTMFRPESAPYTPSGLEIVMAFAIPAAAGLVYLLFSEHLAVLETTQPAPAARAITPPFSLAGLPAGQRWEFAFARRSGLAVLIVALTIAFIPAQRGGESRRPPAPVESARGYTLLVVDGDRDGIAVRFPHVRHQMRLNEESPGTACQTCHHFNPAEEEGVPCSSCHTAFEGTTSIFNHSTHLSELGGNAACTECHAGEHRAQTAVDCVECHAEMLPAAGQSQFHAEAPGYRDSLHNRCLSCHEQQSVETNQPELAECQTCHFTKVEPVLAQGTLWE